MSRELRRLVKDGARLRFGLDVGKQARQILIRPPEHVQRQVDGWPRLQVVEVECLSGFRCVVAEVVDEGRRRANGDESDEPP